MAVVADLFTPLLAVFALIGFIVGFSKTSIGRVAAIGAAVVCRPHGDGWDHRDGSGIHDHDCDAAGLLLIAS